jgi:hypothetical protein
MPKLKYVGKETIDAGELRWSENEIQDVSQSYFDYWKTHYAFRIVEDTPEKIIEQETKVETKIKVKKNKI